MDTKKSIIEELNQNTFLQPLSFEKTNLLNTHKKTSKDFKFDIPEIDSIKLNPKDKLSLVIFSKEWTPEISAAFLRAIDAFAIFFPPKVTENLNYFIVKDEALKQFDKNFSNLSNLRKHPLMAPFCDKLANTDKWSVRAESVPDTLSVAILQYSQPSSYKNNKNIFVKNTLSLREKINFMYFLCANDIDNPVSKPAEAYFKKTCKHFILQHIDAIKNAKSEQEISEIFDKFAKSFLIEEQMMTAKLSQMDTFGKLIKSSPLALPVLLDDGTYTDLFTLDETKEHNVMCCIDISKINQSKNFSNFIINGDFICESAKQPIVLPKKINGFLNLYKYPFISEIKDIPDGATEVSLLYTVKNFSDLNKLVFPKTTSKVFVAHSLINNALKNPQELEQIQIFQDNNPNITVWDEHEELSLQDALEQQQTQSQKPVKTDTIITSTKPDIPEKTSDWLTRKEILNICSKNDLLANVDDLDRLVKRAIKAPNIIKENRIFEGQIIQCIRIDSINNVINSALEIINEDNARSEKKEQNQKSVVIKTEELKNQETINKQTEIIDIQKYIPRNIWKDICDSCKDSDNLLYSILENVNHINTNYTKQTLQQSPVQYIDENGVKQQMSRIKIKSGKAATQTFTNKDDKRIVWTINPNDCVMVAIAFFKHHSKGKQASNYNAFALPNAAKGYLLDGKTFVDKELVKSDDFLNVADLMEQYKPENYKIKDATKNKEQKTSKIQPEPTPVVDITPEPQPIEKKLEPKPQNLEPKPIPVIDVKPIKTVQQNDKTEKIDLSVIEKNKTLTIHKRFKIRNLVDVKAIEAEINAEIAVLDKKIKQASIEINKQKNLPAEQLKLSKYIEKLIQEKIRLIGR